MQNVLKHNMTESILYVQFDGPRMSEDPEEKSTDRSEDSQGSTPGPDEMYCMDCGAVIKKQAEICPECGVRQATEEYSTPAEPQDKVSQNPQAETNASSDITDRRKYELEKLASNDKTTIAVIGFLISPVAYWMIGKKTLAIINFLTFNFFLLGPIVVPIHCYSMISDAEEELRMAGVGGY